MKKNLLIILTSIISLSASAQFTTFEPVIVDRYGNRVEMNSSRSNSNSSSNYYNYNPYNYQQRQQVHSSQTLSTRGYYIKNNQWHPVLLKVKVIGEEIWVTGIKRQTIGWSNCDKRVNSTRYLQEEISNSFDYYVGDYEFGNIYF